MPPATERARNLDVRDRIDAGCQLGPMIAVASRARMGETWVTLRRAATHNRIR